MDTKHAGKVTNKTMHKYLVYAAYGLLTLGGAMHFFIDVVSQYVREKRLPGPETTLYFGLNTAYALSQVLFGLMALLIARKAFYLLDEWPAIAISVGAAGCWLIFTFMFIEYPEPKVGAAIFAVLIIAAAVTA
jgi:hypothetical protein